MGEVTRFIVHSWPSPYGIKIARGVVMKQRRRTGEEERQERRSNMY